MESIITLVLQAAASPTAWAVLFGALYALTHSVALSPRLARGVGFVSVVLNIVAANYGAAANGKALAGRVTGTSDQQPTG